jgi:hypothetical protein
MSAGAGKLNGLVSNDTMLRHTGQRLYGWLNAAQLILARRVFYYEKRKKAAPGNLQNNVGITSQKGEAAGREDMSESEMPAPAAPPLQR